MVGGGGDGRGWCGMGVVWGEWVGVKEGRRGRLHFAGLVSASGATTVPFAHMS